MQTDYVIGIKGSIHGVNFIKFAEVTNPADQLGNCNIYSIVSTLNHMAQCSTLTGTGIDSAEHSFPNTVSRKLADIRMKSCKAVSEIAGGARCWADARTGS